MGRAGDPASAADLLVGRVLQETYVLEKLLGEGGMGMVFEASHRRHARRFAVKLLPRELMADPVSVERFRREAEVTSALGHDNIVEVVDFNTDADGTPYIVMELLRGESLAERLLRCGRLSLPEAVSVLTQAASGLAAAHDKGVIHRDLKPQNIFLCTKLGRDDFVKILDFGISKVAGAQKSLTRSDVVMGTPIYISPEQLKSTARVDPRADVYSLASIFYEVLTGGPVFAGESIPAVLYKVVYVQPRPLHEAAPEVPELVSQVVARALAKDPDDRPASIRELSAQLTEALSRSTAAPAPAPAVSAASAVSAVSTGPSPAAPSHEVEAPSARATTGRGGRRSVVSWLTVVLLGLSAALLGGIFFLGGPPQGPGSETSPEVEPPAVAVHQGRSESSAPGATSHAGEARRGAAVEPGEPDSGVAVDGSPGGAAAPDSGGQAREQDKSTTATAHPRPRGRLLWVSSTPPGARVTFDGRLVCTTPCRGVTVPRTRGEMSIRSEGYAPYHRTIPAGVRSVRLRGVRLRTQRGSPRRKIKREEGDPRWIKRVFD